MSNESSRLHQWLASASVLPPRGDLVRDEGLSTSASDYLHLTRSCQSAGPILRLSCGDEMAERFCPCVLEQASGAVDTRLLIAAVEKLCAARVQLDELLGDDDRAGISERDAFPSFLPAMLAHIRSRVVDDLTTIPPTLPAAHGLATALVFQYNNLWEETRTALTALESDLVRYAVRAVLRESLRTRIFGEFLLPDAARMLDGISRWATTMNEFPFAEALCAEWTRDSFLMRKEGPGLSALVRCASEVSTTAVALSSRLATSLSVVRLVLPSSGRALLREPSACAGETAVRWLACQHASRAMTETRCYLQHPQIVAEWLQSHPSPLWTVDDGAPVTRAEILSVAPEASLTPCQWEIAGALLSDLDQGGDFVAEERLEALVTASRL